MPRITTLASNWLAGAPEVGSPISAMGVDAGVVRSLILAVLVDVLAVVTVGVDKVTLDRLPNPEGEGPRGGGPARRGVSSLFDLGSRLAKLTLETAATGMLYRVCRGGFGDGLAASRAAAAEVALEVDSVFDGDRSTVAPEGTVVPLFGEVAGCSITVGINVV